MPKLQHISVHAIKESTVAPDCQEHCGLNIFPQGVQNNALSIYECQGFASMCTFFPSLRYYACHRTNEIPRMPRVSAQTHRYHRLKCLFCLQQPATKHSLTQQITNSNQAISHRRSRSLTTLSQPQLLTQFKESTARRPKFPFSSDSDLQR